MYVSVYLLKELYSSAEPQIEYKRRGQGQLLHEQARKNLKGLGFDPEATHCLGKCNRIPGCTSSGDFSQLVLTYTIHTATMFCAHLCVSTFPCHFRESKVPVKGPTQLCRTVKCDLSVK